MEGNNLLSIMMLDYIMIGIIGAFLGVFYRTCLKADEMIFNGWYKILRRWVSKGNHYDWDIEPTMFWKVMKFIAYPLGYCIYCSTTWITFGLCFIYLSTWETLPSWQVIVIGVLAATGVQHYIVAVACKYLIQNHPDLEQ